MDFFKYFPTVQYGNNIVTDVLVRTKLQEILKKKINYYYLYAVSDYEKPDTISYSIYGNVRYTWLIFYANNILDPVMDWVKNDQEFQHYINNKYGLTQEFFISVTDQTTVPSPVVIGNKNVISVSVNGLPINPIDFDVIPPFYSTIADGVTKNFLVQFLPINYYDHSVFIDGVEITHDKFIVSGQFLTFTKITPDAGSTICFRLNDVGSVVRIFTPINYGDSVLVEVDGIRNANNIVFEYRDPNGNVIDATTWVTNSLAVINGENNNYQINDTIVISQPDGQLVKLTVLGVFNPPSSSSLVANIDLNNIIIGDVLSGTYVIEQPNTSSVISKYTYEQEINESKRQIKIIYPDYKDQILEELKKTFK